ncbi:MAG: type II toxin-antitoxin system VapC family toxin [Victivallales bacterium]|jgi:PIN domain nuclease of toxin-antitoxin system
MILDTCALLWLADKHRNMSRDTLSRIENAPSVYISAITCFEIALKCKSGKLLLPVAVKSWLDLVLEHHDISVIDINRDVSQLSADLPPYHKDPCDRFIIATAITYNLPVVTADENFRKYGIKVLI